MKCDLQFFRNKNVFFQITFSYNECGSCEHIEVKLPKMLDVF